jgi:hypothetical protein
MIAPREAKRAADAFPAPIGSAPVTPEIQRRKPGRERVLHPAKGGPPAGGSATRLTALLQALVSQELELPTIQWIER